MKKLSCILLISSVVFFSFLKVAQGVGFVDQYADVVIDSTATDNPEAALGPADGTLAKINTGGSLTLDMGSDQDRILNGPGIDLIVFERGNVRYRKAGTAAYEVAVAENLAGPWMSLGTASGDRRVGDEFDLTTSGLTSARYVRITALDGLVAIDSVLAAYTHQGGIHAEFIGTSIGKNYGVVHAPAIGDLDKDGNPEIVVVTQTSLDHCALFVLDGVSKEIKWSFPLLSGCYGGVCNCGMDEAPAIGDIDLDGQAEIVVHQSNASNEPGVSPARGRLTAFKADGSLIWGTQEWPGIPLGGGEVSPALENIDGDPEPEILMKNVYVEPNGTVVPLNIEYASILRIQPVPIDINGDGTPELIMDDPSHLKLEARKIDGTKLWETPIIISGYGRSIMRPAVCDLNGDGLPELVGTAYSENDFIRVVYAVAANTGEVLWRHVFPENSIYRCSESPQACGYNNPCPEGETCELRPTDRPHTSDPTIADLDGDGTPEIVVYIRDLVPFEENDYVVALKAEPASAEDPHGLRKEMWRTIANDHSGDPPSVSTADLDVDGAAEVLWNGDSTGFTIFDGPTGNIRYRDVRVCSPSALDYPVAADVDNDGHIEVITGSYTDSLSLSNPGGSSNLPAGFYILGDDVNWGGGRNVWNQNDYRITNVNDDLSIPEIQPLSWQIHNTYRFQAVSNQNVPEALLIKLTPELDFNPVGTDHTVTALVTDNQGNPLVTESVIFEVVSGPNAGEQETGTTDGNGIVNFTYTGDGGTGLDQIQASVFNQQTQTNVIATALKSWTDCQSNPISDLSPIEGRAFPAGSQIILSGRLLSRSSVGGGRAVLVNGEPVEALDAAGRFFKSVFINNGNNLFTIEAWDSCGSSQTILNLQGIDNSIPGTEGFTDITAHLTDQYADTTFNRSQNWLVVNAQAHNVSFTSIDGAVLMAIGPDLDPAVEPINQHGRTVDDEPYYMMVQEGDALIPDAVGGPVTLLFQNQIQVPVRYDVRWLALGNQLPQFSSVPLTMATSGEPYAYNANALDPNGDAVTFALSQAPATMTINPQTGQISWSPLETDMGAHEVTILARDGHGGTAQQRFTLSVDSTQFNQPPVFTSTPVTQADLGAMYVYEANAVDFDGDPVLFNLVEGPQGLNIDSNSGLVQWPQPPAGQHTISIRANDGRGGETLQTFVLTVGAVSTNQSIPQITGLPDPFSVVGELYVYQPIAIDADGDPLAFSLAVSPNGMTINTGTGLIQWTPEATQLGEQHVTVSVSDGRGGVATQAFTVTVVTSALQPPVFQDPPPPISAIAGHAYSYQALAIDPDGGSISYSLNAAPSGMVINSGTGLLSWTPSGGDIGAHTVVIRATDTTGYTAHLGYQLTVRASNVPPQIVSSPPLTVFAENTYQYGVLASDSDGDQLTFQLTQAPAGMTINSATGLISWLTSVANIGSYPVTVTVSDSWGGSDEQAYSLAVNTDTVPPSALIMFSQEPLPIAESIQVEVSASDNVGVESVGLTVECEPGQVQNLPLDSSHRTTFTSENPRFCIFTATVVDTSANQIEVEQELQVGDPAAIDPYPPVITVISPLPESEVAGPVEIVASITDETVIGELSWIVQVAPDGTDDFHTIGSGSGEVSNGVIATLDPTLLLNGTYQVEVIVDDGIQKNTVDFLYHVTNNLKLGNFSVSFTDLTIPVAGIPMEITREYNSLNTSFIGDFGAGWRLKLAGQVSDSARENPNEGFTTNTRVYVTRPDGRRVSFTFAPEAAPSFFKFLFFPKFEPESGEKGTLTVESEVLFQQANGQFYTLAGPYNPSTYVYTTKEGVSYTLDEFGGLQSIEDLNGNTIDVLPDGLFSSTGVSLTFQRDLQGRIIQIIEPDDPDDTDPPGTLTYNYDEAGNLTEFINQLGNQTKYFYEDANFPNLLTRLEDPLDRPLIRTVYDEEGRLVAQCDDNGNVNTLQGCTTFDPNANDRIQTIINARGFRTDLFFDDRGNILTERHFLADGNFLDTVRTYDDANNMLTEADPEGNTSTFTYDERGNMLTRTDPSGGQKTYSYNDHNKVLIECDELNNCKKNSYDENGNLRFVEDALGGVTEYQYNSKGQVAEMIDAVSNHWKFGYDAFGRPSNMTDPLGNSALLQVNLSGELKSFIDREGRRIDFEYDNKHRLVTETWDTNPPSLRTYEYNAAGQLTRALTPESELTIEYANTGLVKRVDNIGTPNAPNVVINYEYDDNGNVTQVLDSLGGITTYEYDALDRLVSVNQSGSSINEKRINYVLDDASLLREIHRFADLLGTQPVANTFLDYDCGGCQLRLSSIQHRKAGNNSVIHDMQFQRDSVGDILRIVNAEGTHVYTYDNLLRLLDVQHPAEGVQPDESYSYDTVDNRLDSHLSSEYVYGYLLNEGGSQLLQDDEFDYVYDNNGNLVLKTCRLASPQCLTGPGEYTEYAYNHRNRLVTMLKFDSTGSLLGRFSYTYDAANRRIRANENGDVSHFIYDGLNPILKLDTSGNEKSRRMYGRKLDEILADEMIGESRWFLTDQIGTVTDIVRNNGTTLNHYIYDSFGRLLSQSDQSIENDLLFNGREFNKVTGLGYYRARYYDPGVGRFLSEDLRSPWNYTFVSNSPLRLIDPMGVEAADYAILAAFIGLAFTLNDVNSFYKLQRAAWEIVEEFTQMLHDLQKYR